MGNCNFKLIASIVAVTVPVVSAIADSCFLKIARVTGHNVLGKALTEKETQQIRTMITSGVDKDLIEKYTYGEETSVSPTEDKPTWSRKVALDSGRVEPENVEHIWNNLREIILEAEESDLKTVETRFSFHNNEWAMHGFLKAFASDALRAKFSKIQDEIAPLKRLAEHLTSLARDTFPEAKDIKTNLVFTPNSITDDRWHQHPGTLTLITQLKEGGEMTRINNEMKPERGDLVALIGPHASPKDTGSGPRVVLVVFIELY